MEVSHRYFQPWRRNHHAVSKRRVPIIQW